MADINEVTQEAPVAQTQEIPAELKQQMDLALGMKPVEPAQPTQEQNTPTQPVPHETAPQFDLTPFKERFGIEKQEDLLSIVEEYNRFKAEPPKPVELPFENDFSKNLFDAIKGGKIPDVYAALDQHLKLEKLTSSEITNDNADEIIKLGMKLEYPTLSEQEIDYQYKQQYKLPKEPVKGELEDDDDFEQRKADYEEAVYDIKMRKTIAAKMAQPKLEAAKTKISFPEIEKQVDPEYQEYLQYKKELEEDERIDAETKEAYKAFTPKDGETKLPFIDEANKINFEFQFEPDGEGFAKTIDLVSNPGKFYDLYKNPDGTSNRKKFLEDVYFSQNRERIIMEAMKQAKNAAIKAMLPDNSAGTGLNRQPVLPDVQQTELDKQMEMALKPYMRGNGRLQPTN